MRKYWLVVLAVVLFANLCANRVELVAYEENFDGDISQWHHYDGAESPNNWHIHDFGGAQGDVWWMGDPELASGGHPGGYYNRQYLVLDTPAQTITAANATLTFKMRLGLEDPAVHDEYDGWDSANIRISTNGGSTWQVITGTPAYHFQNSYAFGNIHGEGLGIAGWGGIHTDWISASFNLSAYIGQSVMIRFAFGSDPAYNTTNNAALFGFMVDDISFGGYTNNGVDDGQMVASSMVPLGGDLWHLFSEPSAPSAPYVMKNQNAAGSYNQNMMNYLVSPTISLPPSGEIRADFMIMGDFSDSGTFPETAYFGWEISPDNGFSWLPMSNPYDDPEGSNYVYSDAPSVWASMTQSYSLDGYITEYAGHDVKFRWYFQSPALPPQGTGIMIDDFRIYNEIYIANPSNLETVVEEANVFLTWDAAGGGGGGGEEGWLHYDEDNSGNSIGTGGDADFDVAIRWDAQGGENSISPYVGMNVTKMKFFPSEAACEYTLRLYTGGGNQVVYEQLAPNPAIGQWNEVLLTSPFTIPSGVSFAAGYRCNAQTGHPAGIDGGPAENGYGNMIKLGGWSSLLDAHDIDGNWNIRIYVADADGREYVIGNLPVENESYANAPFEMVQTHRTQRSTPSAYNIYRDEIMIDEVDGSVTSFTDMNVEPGLHRYHVTAVFGPYESEPSNYSYAFVIDPNATVLSYDDGTSEMGLSVGSNRQMAVKFETPEDRPALIKHAAVYVHTYSPAAIMLRVYQINPDTGLPGSQLTQIQYPAANVAPGWNYIPFTQPLEIPTGKFYMGVLETPGASLIGVDTDNSGHSYTNPGSGWALYNTGEIMIRAIVELGVDNEDEIAPVLTLGVKNYPNPFNPNTTIAYTVPENGMTSVKIYNLKGQMINALVNKEMVSGNHTVSWNGTDSSGNAVSSGIYFLKVENGGKSVQRKILLSK